MNRLSVVIPALNEVDNLEAVIGSVPVAELAAAGWETEIVVVDNASTDGTGDEARRLGARVVEQPNRGYGNAYMAGFAEVSGDVVITGDADQTYPLDHAVALVNHLIANNLDFITCNRLGRENRDAMKPSHTVGNKVLSAISRVLFGNPIQDSQSGMWVFRRDVWATLDVRSSGMQFSQEIKNEAYASGARCGEVAIEYRPRGGEVKLNAWKDGLRNLWQLFEHRFRVNRAPRLALEAARTLEIIEIDSWAASAASPVAS
ncbi:hypothetical protein Back2_00310 [Nocardioides baekrokdamisoli]|uniref:Glycosyltransferase 2-like domain-containing protein n=1 Tax=Nocardioides baekrokdamisoli TaxID=1804624 RepID=A0A3G9IX51_9ACTN|nr:glycosyltransferase family 2 protein [Nocardioides baekrokdamisoli]BBH15744.1 hypothetical protein Back2_00310 [Nocardioides baekrokdamisoli]